MSTQPDQPGEPQSTPRRYRPSIQFAVPPSELPTRPGPRGLLEWFYNRQHAPAPAPPPQPAPAADPASAPDPAQAQSQSPPPAQSKPKIPAETLFREWMIVRELILHVLMKFPDAHNALIKYLREKQHLCPNLI